MKLRRNLLSVIALFLFSGCGFKNWIAKEFMQGTIADGTSRLSVQHASMILSEAMKQFKDAGPQVEIIPSKDPKEYGKGTVIWTLKDVEINRSQEEVVHTDCNGDQGLWKGHIRLSATKTLYGRLTNNPDNPVVPDLGTLKIDISAEASNLVIRFPSRDEYLEIHSGKFEFTAFPRLAQSPSGMRLTPTSNTRFENFKLKNMQGTLRTNDIVMDVDIQDSSMTIQMGKGENGDENSLSGFIRIFGNRHEVPRDKQGLDPNYESNKFQTTYDCHQDLKEGVSYDHVPMEQKLAPGVAGLTGRIMGLIAGELEKSSECGFLNGEIANNLILSGEPGQMGSLTARVDKSCVLNFEKIATKPDCFGLAQELSGSVKIEGAVKTLEGIVFRSPEDFKEEQEKYARSLTEGKPLTDLIADYPKAILPASMRPVVIELTVSFERVNMKDLCLLEGKKDHPRHCTKQNPVLGAFNVYSGLAKAELKPLLAKDLREGMSHNTCAIPTAIGEAQFTLTNLIASIDREGNDVHMAINGSYHLINGPIGSKENELRGELFLNGISVPFKGATKDYVPVDEKYRREWFLDSIFSCDDTISLPKSDDECKVEENVGNNLARLLVMNAGGLVKVASSSSVPDSFASLHAVRTRELKDNGMSLVLKALHKAPIDVGSKVSSSVDGVGVESRIRGQVEDLEGTMTRRGIRLNEPHGVLDFFNPLHNRFAEGIRARLNDTQEIFVRPTSWRSTIIDLKASLRNFSLESRHVHHNQTLPSLVVVQGHYQLKAEPIMAVDARTRADAHVSYSIPTPVIEFKDLTVDNATVILRADNLRIPLYIESARLKAFNGRFSGEGNYVEGTIRFSVGQQPETPEDLTDFAVRRIDLNPNYSQAEFDQSYANTPHLEGLISAH